MESPQQTTLLTKEELAMLEELDKKPILFPQAGKVLATQGVIQAIPEAKEAYFALQRHLRGDWGDVSPEDAEANNQSVKTKDRIISSYTSTNGTKFWIVTDAGHEITTILLPDEY